MRLLIFLESWCDMKKYKYNINNLDCANCARKVEEELNKNDKLNNVIVNFSTSIISYETDSFSKEDVLKIINKFEPDVTLTEKKQEKKYKFKYLLIGVLIGILGCFINNIIGIILMLVGYVVLLYNPFIKGIKILKNNKSIDENALIVISCIGAFIIGERLEGLMVVALYMIGKILEEKAVNNTRHSIESLVSIKQDYGNKKIDNKYKKVNIEEIQIDDILLIKKGEKIPVDGIVIKGHTSIDQSAITGEADLVKVKEYDDILSGSINMGDVIEIKVTKTYENSTVSKILNLVSEATDKKAKTETFVSKASKIYTPIVLILAIIITLLLPILFNISYLDSIYRGLTFLVISCPCAIAISVPLSYFTAIGVASKNGILIKGSNYLDNLIHVNKIIFDKTGTITSGSFEVEKIEIIDKTYTKEQVIDILVKGESLSNHPIATSILKLSNKTINTNDIKDFQEVSGKGIKFKLNDDQIYIGSKKDCNCEYSSDIHLNINNKHVASIYINDGIKKESKECIRYLKQNNIKTYMFTGDKKETAKEVGKIIDIDYIKSEMLPQDKYNCYEEVEKLNDVVVFVGDGINDAPVLKRATIGISMGSKGSDSAIEASDIVIMNDKLNSIVIVHKISKYTKNIIIQNLVFALGIKIIILLLSAIGIATMWFAVFADTGVTLITILNTLRILKKFKICEK